MTFQLVSLLSCLLVASVRGLFPPMFGGLSGYPFTGGLNQNQHYNQQQLVDPLMMTCINADAQDPQSQIRLTIKPLNNQHGAMGSLGAMHPLGLGFGDLSGGAISKDQPMDWTVDGMLLPSQVVQKAGSYQVGIFQGGRTHGQCQMSALGSVMNNAQQGGYGGLAGPFGFGPFSALNLNPFAGLMGGLGGMGGMYGAHAQPNGIIGTAIVSTGTTMYSGIIKQVPYNMLIGKSMAVCDTIQGSPGGQCYGRIPYCCSITSDTLPASEVFQEPTMTTNAIGGVPGVGLNMGLNGVGVGMGNTGLVGTQPGLAVGGVGGVPGVGVGVGVPGDVGVVGVANPF